MAAITIRQVRKKFGSFEAISGVDLDIEEGEFFGLLGPNGAGKTTLINLLSGLCLADEGELFVKGFNVATEYKKTRMALGVVPQELVFDPFFSVREVLEIQSGFFGLRKNDDWIDEILHHLDLSSKANTNMRMLSGGMKRRVLVAQALVHKPPVIVLDEPTAGVDVELRQGLWRFIRSLNEKGHTILLTTHYLEEAQALCGRIAMLKSGKIVALDTTKNILKDCASRQVGLTLEPDFLPDALKKRLIGKEAAEYLLTFDHFADLENILAILRETKITIAEMRLFEPGLEEAFVRIMGTH